MSTIRPAHLPNWRVYLDALVYARLHAPFAWGVNDCVLFAADAVAATTGVDLAAQVRGYCTARQALRMIRARGGLHAIASRALGHAIAPAYACPGDVALVASSPGSKRESLAVCLTAGSAAAPGREGLQAVPMSHARCVWRVG